MAKIRTIQLYRGTTAQNEAYTGSAGELTMDTTLNEVRVHDGSTAGGHIIYNKSDVDIALSGKANTDLDNLTATGKGKLGVSSIQYADGIVLSSATDPVRGAGRVLVSLYPNGKAKIDFAIKISTSGSSVSVFVWGIDPNLLHSLNNNIPVITPGQGTCQYYTTSGSISTSKQGYGGAVIPTGNYWSFGRVYQTDGAVGGWPANQFAVDQMIYGTAWGTYSV